MEILDVYDINKNKLNKTVVRGVDKLGKDEYVRGVSIFIKNGIRFLMQLTSKEKGSVYATTSGCVTKGNEPLEQAVIECKEELDLDVNKDNLKFMGSVYIDSIIIDSYLYEDERDLEEFEFHLQKEEVAKILWLSGNEIEDMILKGMIRESTARAYLNFIKDKC